MPYDITYMWNLKYDITERIHETDRQRTDLWLPRERGKREMVGSLGLADANYYI